MSKRYGAVAALHDVSVTLQPATVTSVLGQPSAGKTTLLQIASGLIKPDSGSVHILGQPTEHLECRDRLGFVPSDPQFANGLSGTSNLDALSRIRGVNRAHGRNALIQELGLGRARLEQPVGTYSPRERRLLGLLAAFEHKPDLVLVDDVRGGDDGDPIDELRQLLHSLTEHGGAALLASSDPWSVGALASDAILLRDGGLTFQGPYSEIYARCFRTVIITYEDEGTASDCRLPSDVETLLVDKSVLSNRVSFRLPPGELGMIRRILADPRVLDLTISEPTLDEMTALLVDDLPSVAS